MKDQFYKKIEIKLDNLIVNHITEINIKDLIIEIYGRYDFYLRRSFDVMFCNLRKKYDVKFKVEKGIIKKVSYEKRM
jgi:hypothetical protein